MSDLDKYNKVFADVFPNTQIELGEAFVMKDVGEWDSIAHLSLISQLEDTFDVMFETEEILHFGSYENGKRILQKYGIQL